MLSDTLGDHLTKKQKNKKTKTNMQLSLFEKEQKPRCYIDGVPQYGSGVENKKKKPAWHKFLKTHKNF